MTDLIPAGAFLVLLLWLARRSPRRVALQRQRQMAERAHLDTYTPQSVDREWSQWTQHHGGGL